MGTIKIWGWEKKPRTMLRFIKSGDIFCFALDPQRYAFGRIIVKGMVGHFAEILDWVSAEPSAQSGDIEGARRLTDIVILDSYSLFDRKSEGEWRIIGRQEDYAPVDVADAYFAWGIGSGCRKSNALGDTLPISEEEWRALPPLSPAGDWQIKQKVLAALADAPPSGRASL